MIVVVGFLVIFDIEASSANIKGFQIENWEYRADIQKQRITLKGDKYVAGYAEMWSAMYRLYDYAEDYTYYMILTTMEIEAVKNSYWDQRYWSNRFMDLTVKSLDGFKVFTYGPTMQNSRYETNMGVQLEAGSDRVAAVVSISVNNQHSEVDYDVSKPEPNDSINFKYTFTRYRNDAVVTSTGSVYRNNYSVNNYVIYRIKGKDIEIRSFDIRYIPTIHRNGRFNASNISQEMLTYIIV